MPKKSRTSLTGSRRTKRTQRAAAPKETTWFDMISKIRFSESYVSLLLGVIVVVILAVLFITTARSLRQPEPTKQTSSISTVASQNTISQVTNPSVTPTAVPTEQPKEPTAKPTSQPVVVPQNGTYVVKAGDTLWSIAEAQYKSGYNWVDIAKANNLSNPGEIHAGNMLVMPKTVAKLPQTTIAAAKQPVANAITGTTYKIKRGDDLWDIAVRAYGDGYRWVDIAKANNLTNPSLIHADNTLTLPR